MLLTIDFEYVLFSRYLGMVLETQMTLCVTEPDFFRKISFAQTLRKWVKIGPKRVFLNFLRRLIFNFY